MSLEQYAYLAEIVAAMAVVPSLIYLAVQVRQSNAQTRAAARFAFVEATGDINAVIAQDKSVASLWRRGLRSPEDLARTVIDRKRGQSRLTQGAFRPFRRQKLDEGVVSGAAH